MERTIKVGEAAKLLTAGDVIVIDVSRKDNYAAENIVVPGAKWRDPEQVAQWQGELPTDKPVIIYCVRSSSASNAVVDSLCARDLDAAFIDGGIKVWKSVVERPGDLSSVRT